MNNWLQNLRDDAAAASHALPAPTNKDENYRFSALPELIFDGEFSSFLVPEVLVTPEFRSLDDGEEALLSLCGRESKFYGNASGACFESLSSAVLENPQTFKEHFSSPGAFLDDKFALLAAARWENGVYLRVPKNTSLILPFRAAQYFSGERVAFRSLIIVEEGASLTFVDEFAGDATFITGLIEIEVHKNAHLRYSQVQRLGEAARFNFRQEFNLSEGATLELFPIYIGGAEGQLRQVTKLLGSGATTSVKAATRGSDAQHFDFWMDVEHSCPNTKSALDFYFVMDGNSRAVFNGLININKEAENTEAYQKSRALMLSDKVQVNAIPKLIIKTDAVKCAHGASVSSILPEQVHYLQSRGITRQESERMIVRGFTEPVLECLPTDAIYDRVEALIAKKEELLQ